MKAYNDGVEVFLKNCVVCSPAIYIEEARSISCAYLECKCLCCDNLTLPTGLSPTGEAPATHYACFMEEYCHGRKAMIDHIAKENHSWCADQAMSENDDPSEVLSKYGLTVIESKESFLIFANLKEV